MPHRREFPTVFLCLGVERHKRGGLGRLSYVLQEEQEIARVRGRLGRIEREWLAWHNDQGYPYPLPLQRAAQLKQSLFQEQQRAEQAELEKLQLLEKLKQLGIDLDDGNVLEGETV